MTKRVIFLLFENEECVGYASFRQNNKGISSYHGTYFPSINCYLESWRLKNEMLFLEFFQQIYQNLQEPFLIETEYESDMKTYMKNEHCLPIVPFYHEGCGFCVFPKTHFQDIEFDHSNWTINEDEDNIDWNAINRRCSAMKIISSSIYPGLDRSNKIIEWS